MAFGHYIRRQREGRDMTLTELARRVEISIAYLSRIERERENPAPDHLISALAGALGLPADDLFAAARRLPPDLRARTDHVIAVYRKQAAVHLCASARSWRSSFLLLACRWQVED